MWENVHLEDTQLMRALLAKGIPSAMMLLQHQLLLVDFLGEIMEANNCVFLLLGYISETDDRTYKDMPIADGTWPPVWVGARHTRNTFSCRRFNGQYIMNSLLIQS